MSEWMNEWINKNVSTNNNQNNYKLALKNYSREYFQNFFSDLFQRITRAPVCLFRRDQNAASVQGRRASQAPRDQLDLGVLEGHQGPWDLGASKAIKGMKDQWALEAQTDLMAHQASLDPKDQWALEV